MGISKLTNSPLNNGSVKRNGKVLDDFQETRAPGVYTILNIKDKDQGYTFYFKISQETLIYT